MIPQLSYLDLAALERREARRFYREALRYERNRNRLDLADEYRALARSANARARRYEALSK